MEGGGPEWNISKDFGQSLQGIIDKVNEAAFMGDIHDWYNGLWLLYINVAGHKKMNQTEVQKVHDKLKGMTVHVSQKEARTAQGAVFKKALDSNVKYDMMILTRDLITEMHKAGLILPVTEERPRNKTILG